MTRSFAINVLEFTRQYPALPTGSNPVTAPWSLHSLDVTSALAPFSGQTVRIEFALNVPQLGTGPGAFGLDQLSLDIASVPEPATYALLVAGLGVVLAFRRRKMR